MSIYGKFAQVSDGSSVSGITATLPINLTGYVSQSKQYIGKFVVKRFNADQTTDISVGNINNFITPAADSRTATIKFSQTIHTYDKFLSTIVQVYGVNSSTFDPPPTVNDATKGSCTIEEALYHIVYAHYSVGGGVFSNESIVSYKSTYHSAVKDVLIKPMPSFKDMTLSSIKFDIENGDASSLVGSYINIDIMVTYTPSNAVEKASTGGGNSAGGGVVIEPITFNLLVKEYVKLTS